jgi:hypothetical protein
VLSAASASGRAVTVTRPSMPLSSSTSVVSTVSPSSSTSSSASPLMPGPASAKERLTMCTEVAPSTRATVSAESALCCGAGSSLSARTGPPT